jgi:hypothetical protein
MIKKIKPLDFTTKKPLIDRQRNLWNIAESIEFAIKEGEPLPEDISKWLYIALQNIACGVDANEVFNVIPEKVGVRKDGFLREMQRKIANGYLAAATEATNEGSKPKKTSEAIEEISQAMPDTKKTTVRKNWNRITTDRKPEFTIGKK